VTEGLPYGPYNLIKRLAVGGMAEVFLARPRSEAGAPRLVVVKRMLPLLMSDPEISRMFLDEARIAAQLSHPFLIQVFDVGSIDSTFYIAMDYVHGVNMKDLLAAAKARGQPVPWTLAVRLASSLCEVLEYVHELKSVDGTPLQLVHRDITPSNIMVTYTGAPKLVDFGIARAAQRLTETKPGVVKGKLLYAAPEQYTHRQADARTDLYGLAICLYEMLVGENPFASVSTPFEAASAVAKQVPPSVLGARPDVPRKLADAIASGLEKDPSKRPQSAGDFRRRLEGAIASAQAVVGMPELARWMAQLYPGRAALDQARNTAVKEDVPTQRDQLVASSGETLPLRATPERPAPVLVPLPPALRHGDAPSPLRPASEGPPEFPTKVDPTVMPPAPSSKLDTAAPVSGPPPPTLEPPPAPVPMAPGPAHQTAEIVSLPAMPEPSQRSLTSPELRRSTGTSTLPQTRRVSRWPRRLATLVVVLAALGASAYGALQLRRALETASASRPAP
jgi:serine/threonine protein kinase